MTSLRALMKDKKKIIKNIEMRYNIDSDMAMKDVDELDVEVMCQRASALTECSALENSQMKAMLNTSEVHNSDMSDPQPYFYGDMKDAQMIENLEAEIKD